MDTLKLKNDFSGKLVKCQVCGEIFDSSLEKCPTCGAGKDRFVPVETKETNYSNDTNDFYVIIGNGAAGINAAKAIRARDKTGSIVMISKEQYSTYHRPMLTKALVTNPDAKSIAVQDESWYEENCVYQVLGKEIVEIDTRIKEVILNDGTRLKYTKLIYAAGAECFIPPIPGKDKPEVIAIRRLEDTRKIAELLPRVKHVAVIGGGVLGLEAAWALRTANCQVTVLETGPSLMGRQLDAPASDLLREIAQGQGIRILTGVQTASIQGEEHVTGVKLVDGTEIPAELVIVSAGVRANITLAKAVGMETDRAVVVNDKMETSIKDIYACGDCAQYQGVNYSLWSVAVEQGTIAGANAAGEELTYEMNPAALHFNGMNTALFAIGDAGKNPNLVYKALEYKDLDKKQYQKLYFLNDVLCGVILIGDVSRLNELTEAVQKQVTYKEMVKKFNLLQKAQM